ncbi:MAG TPA: class I SAM-dependent methyltransferase [Zoogloea sp.]|uniref:class I SAM-dependent methyltransferase n=1 Tax=Zoogloea sp. TaxID=49181 RepID=UPI002CA82379|nr:class I SAM-dependent methyltransferase [Zoogloea sp.]HMV17989.1 class I SAM-dependent methyltransferase [Rhodocyclaceae bacterium]HMV62249.1 class I SAM-dependent methyltransferase [Rhodocyclaceae bacterium]HMW50795.1 class I SAM-dependent methyltransferase [Rhodocyclaceae bacterium]HMZ74943.1 class I SAM-dependent methyltransferase [Rhodocyclaceae bacterium]HNA66468.1 class I SAM-dependent methyltransferase [Rhodocyclaceae bacterium]
MSTTCRLCGHPLFPEPLLVQHAMPAAAQGLPTAEQLADDQGVTLALHQCAGCATVQLANPPVPYWREVIRAAGLSAEMRAFRREQFGRWIAEHDLTGRKVLEVGCGRGEYLALLAEAGADAHGLEYAPAAVAACHAAGLHAHRGFLEDPSIRLASGPFDGFAILNFLEHIPAAPLTLQAIAANLTDGASGLVEVPNFDMILRAGLFAEFIPDHLFYFTRQTLTALLERNGFDVLDCRPAWHDYVLSATVRKRRPLDLSPLLACQDALKAAFDAFLARFAPGRVAIWGAGHQALALISLMALAPRVAYVVDSAPFKQGRYTPATHRPIVAPERLADGEVDAVIVLAASYSDEVARILRERHGSRFTVAVLRDNRLDTVIAP